MTTLIVSAVVMRDSDGRIALVRKAGTTRFMLPGGKHEPDETPSACAVREIREELGVDLEESQLRLIGEWEAAAANEPDHLVRGHVFLHPWVPGMAPGAEIAELLWLHPDHVADRMDLAPLFEHRVLPALSSLEP